MRTISHTISDRKLFEKQLLTYFKDKKHVVFLNSNDVEKTNLFAVSDSDYLNNKETQFGFISYDYKNQIEELSSAHFDGIQFPEKHFFTPEILFKIEETEVNISFEIENAAIERIITEIQSVSVTQQEIKRVKRSVIKNFIKQILYII